MKIPTIDPQANKLSGQSPNRQINRDEAGNIGQVISSVGQGLSDIGGMIEKVRTAQETTAAETHLSKRLQEIQFQVEQDTDVSAQKQQYYAEEINKARREAGSLISIPLERDMFDKQAEVHTNVAGIRVRGYQAKVLVDKARANFIEYLDAVKQQYVQTQNPRERAMIVGMRDAKIKQLVDAGVLSAEGAAETKQRQDSIWREEQMKYDMRNHPEYTIAELKKDNGGEYKDVDADTRASLLAQFEKAHEKAVKQQERAQKAKRTDLEANRLSQWVTDPLTYTEQDVKNDLEAKVISPEFASSMISRVKAKSKKVSPEVRFKAYEELYSDVFNPDVRATDFKKKMNEALADGKINASDAKRLWYVKLGGNDASMYEVYQSEIAGDEIDSFEESKKTNPLKTAWDFIGQHFTWDMRMAGKIFSRVVDKMMANGVSADQAPKIAVEEVKNAVKENHPQTVGLKDVPHAVMTNSGLQHTFSGDTEIEADESVQSGILPPENFDIGDIVVNDEGKEFEVVDFDADGEPLFEEVAQ